MNLDDKVAKSSDDSVNLFASHFSSVYSDEVVVPPRFSFNNESDTISIETIPVLPEFHPSRGTDPLQWINTIELCLDEDTKINSRALILTLSRSTKGSAASWFARQANSHLCWYDFKLAFVGEFAVLDTPATALNKLFNTSPKGVLDYVPYANNMMSVLGARLSNMSAQEICVNITLAHMDKADNRILRSALTKEITTKDAQRSYAPCLMVKEAATQHTNNPRKSAARESGHQNLR
ncbi:hypothetical protein M8J76_017333 [Diaphorina citri]|nr:hypothetical protein M8J76_017333 [Diaphorina citri]